MRIAITTIGLVSALALGACGGGGNSASSGAATADTAPTTAGAAAPTDASTMPASGMGGAEMSGSAPMATPAIGPGAAPTATGGATTTTSTTTTTTSSSRPAASNGGGVDRTSIGGHGGTASESTMAREVGTRNLNDAAPSGSDANGDGIADTAMPSGATSSSAPAQ